MDLCAPKSGDSPRCGTTARRAKAPTGARAPGHWSRTVGARLWARAPCAAPRATRSLLGFRSARRRQAPQVAPFERFGVRSEHGHGRADAEPRGGLPGAHHVNALRGVTRLPEQRDALAARLLRDVQHDRDVIRLPALKEEVPGDEVLRI